VPHFPGGEIKVADDAADVVPEREVAGGFKLLPAGKLSDRMRCRLERVPR